MSPLLAVALSVSLTGASTDPSTKRVAVLVSSNVGGSGDLSLRHTNTDSSRMADVLVELGQFATRNVHLLQEATVSEVQRELMRIRGGDPTGIFLFYYSGHAEAGALRIAGQELSMGDLVAALEKIPARLRIVVIDACQSGSATRPKGFTQGPAFDVNVSEMAEGQVLIASSAADEQSFESDKARGAVFTFHWTVGLRGAADRDGDARVTLSEAYTYAYDQTVRDTLLSQSGPQHPSFRWEISGRRDPVLTFLKAKSALTLWAENEGRYLVFGQGEKELIAETPTSGGQRRRIALSPGRYVVRKRGPASLRVAQVELKAGDDRVLYEHEMREVPLVSLAQKGSLGKLGTFAAVGQYGSGLGPRHILQASVGPEWERPHWLIGGELQFSRGSEKHGGLVTTTTGYAAQASALYGWHSSSLAVWAGPALALEYLHQEHRGAPARGSLVVRGGLAARVDLSITPRLNLFVRGAGMGLLANTVNNAQPSPHQGLALLWWASYSGGLRVSW